MADQVLKLISENHDLQVRFRWSENDMAIWDKYVSALQLDVHKS